MRRNENEIRRDGLQAFLNTPVYKDRKRQWQEDLDGTIEYICTMKISTLEDLISLVQAQAQIPVLRNNLTTFEEALQNLNAAIEKDLDAEIQKQENQKQE